MSSSDDSPPSAVEPETTNVAGSAGAAAEAGEGRKRPEAAAAASAAAPAGEEKKEEDKEEGGAGAPLPKKARTGDLDGDGNGDAPAGEPLQQRQQPPATGGVTNVCDTLGLKAGDRIEVLFSLDFSGGDGDDGGGSSSSAGATVERYWWPATIAPSDGRTHTLTDDGETREVAVTSLDYDPYRDGGYPERSIEDVFFVSKRLVLNLSASGEGAMQAWRRVGDAWEPDHHMAEMEDGTIVDLREALNFDLGDVLGPEKYEGMTAEKRARAERRFGEVRARIVRRLADLAGRAPLAQSDLDQVRDELVRDLKAENELKVAVDGDVSFRAKNDEDVRRHLATILDTVLGSALAKLGSRMDALPRAQQCTVAERVAEMKGRVLEKLVEKMREERGEDPTRDVIMTPEHMKMVMAEVGRELGHIG